MMATAEDFPVLQLEYSGAKKYSQTFRVPPADKLFGSMDFLRTKSYEFQDLRFTTDFLAEIDHSWDLKILSNRALEIRFRLKDPEGSHPERCFLFREARVLLLAGDEVIGTAELDLESRYIGKDYVYSATTQRKKEYYDYIRPNKYKRTSNPYITRRWNNSVDSIRVEFQFKCESTGKCLNSQESQPAEFGGSRNLNTKDFFLNDFLSVVTLVCESERFPAHRLVLSCQSAVFQRMFQTDMTERTEGVVEIEDVDSDVLKEVLHFMYKDELSTTEIGDDLWLQLYKFAHLYDIQVLKLKCQNQILGIIRPENVIQVLVWADLYNDEKLRLKAVELIKRDKKNVMAEAATFKDFTNRYPQLAFDLFKT